MSDEVLDAREALRNANWEEILPPLIEHAEWRLRRQGWLGPTSTGPMSVAELVNAAIDGVLKGERKWHRTDGVAVVPFLCRVMDSMTDGARKKLRRFRDEEPPDTADPIGHVEDQAVHGERILALRKMIEDAIDGDDDLIAYYLAADEVGPKRENIAAKLGWSLARTSVAKKKLKRRLIALGVGPQGPTEEDE